MAQAGISTLGAKLLFGVETTAGTKPSSFSVLTRIAQIGGISIEPETLDASTLEDTSEKSIAGRASTGGKFTVTVNYTDATRAEWEGVITAYTALTGGKQMWFEVYSPYLNKSFYVIAQPPTEIPMPEFSNNSVLTVDIPLTIVSWEGADTPVIPT